MNRIVQHNNWHEAQLQAQTESVILLHSIRIILIWTLIIVPIIAAIAVGVLVGVSSGESSSYY